MDPLDTAQTAAAEFAASGDSSAHGHALSEPPTAQMMAPPAAIPRGDSERGKYCEGDLWNAFAEVERGESQAGGRYRVGDA
jgi:hypothetical protein